MTGRGPGPGKTRRPTECEPPEPEPEPAPAPGFRSPSRVHSTMMSIVPGAVTSTVFDAYPTMKTVTWYFPGASENK